MFKMELELNTNNVIFYLDFEEKFENLHVFS